jgi:hypothetical protein
MKFFKNVWNLLPAMIGTVESLLPPIKEIAVNVVRVVAILPFLWSVDEPIITKINAVYDVIIDWVEKIKAAMILR